MANAAAEGARGGPLAGMTLLNLASVLGIGGIPEAAFDSVEKALETDLTPTQRNLATATIALWEAEHEGNLDTIADNLRELAVRQDRAGHQRYAGVTRVDLAGILLWLGDTVDAVRIAARAEVDLGAPGSPEYVAAVAARATGLAQLGRLDEAVNALRAVMDSGSRLDRDEAAIELAKILFTSVPSTKRRRSSVVLSHLSQRRPSRVCGSSWVVTSPSGEVIWIQLSGCPTLCKSSRATARLGSCVVNC